MIEDGELVGLPGDLHDAIVREIRAHIPSVDKSKATILTQSILIVFVRHYQKEAEKENEQP